MSAVLMLAFAGGAAFGLAQLRGWALIPATAIFALITVVVGLGAGLGAGRIALVVFCVAMLLQVSYLIGSVLSDVPGGYPVSDYVPSEQELLRIVRAAIAEELPTYFEPLGEVPPELRSRLAQLEAS